jgi:hypothetical protein
MFRNQADSQADLERFVRRVAETDEVWRLTSPETGTAMCEADAGPDDGDDEANAAVLLFFSDRAYAERARKAHFLEHEPEAISLFDFLYRWLPGMSGDGCLAGPNWSHDLVGIEIDPFELRELLEAAMTQEHRDRHEALFRQLTAKQN